MTVKALRRVGLRERGRRPEFQRFAVTMTQTMENALALVA